MKKCYIISLSLWINFYIQSFAQENTQEEIKGWFTDPYKYKPLKAALLSAVLPGAGQIYNKKQLYIRLPIIYVGFASFGLAVRYNHKQYVDARNALIYSMDNNLMTTPEQIDPNFSGANDETLRSRRDFFRYRRDLMIIFSILWYGLNIAEAAATSHLLGFDISDDLSARIEPSINKWSYNRWASSINIKFVLK